MDEHQGEAAGTKSPRPTPATKAYKDAARRMHVDMGVVYSGEADRDFAQALGAHHTGAVALAQVELQYGSDPEMRQLAEAVVASREKEIALMKAWLAKHK